MPNGVRARFYEECDSTNAVAAQIAKNEPTEKAIWIVAGKQSAGKGRRGRVWTSESGNLYCSLLWKPSLEMADLAPLPFITALAVRDMFLELGVHDYNARCKWPNDVLLSDKKASGILIESSAKAAGKLDYVVIGIGVNLRHFPNDAAFSATSLFDELAGMINTPQDAIKVLAQAMYTRLDAFDADNPQAIYREWTSVSWGLGETREIRTANETFNGTPLRLADDGGLEVETEGSGIIKIYAGDVFPAKTNS
jgi:BirA family biotin operon repressor/biotin-[acetyl-CoA-carboxylase] ligase